LLSSLLKESRMSSVVSAVLAEAALAESQLGSTSVIKPLELELDLGNMLAVDPNQLELPVNSQCESELLTLARDNIQLLVNSIWQLETEVVENVVVAKFPPPTTTLPREKPAPKPKPMTKWEKYAKEKGIEKKKKKDRLVWDDVVQKWVPQFGYKKVQVEQDKNWMMPLKGNAPDTEDPFEKEAEAKREKVAKNELQRLRNLARAKKVQIPSVGNLPVVQKDPVKAVSQSEDLKKAAELAKTSTASLGKFQENLSKKLEKSAKVKGTKRKFESNTADSSVERARTLGILESITNKSAKIDIDAAVNKQIFKEDQERRTEKEKERDSKSKKKKSGKGKRDKAHFANKGGKGKFTGKSKGINRANKGKGGMKGRKGQIYREI